MQLGTGFWASKTLLSAVELGLFTELSKSGPLDAEGLRKRLDIHPRSARDFFDALDKHDPGGMRWTLAGIQNLRTLLNAAAVAGRTVVLTSDHGHVVERGSEARPVPGAAARHRSVESGGPGADEISVRGRRVVSGPQILPWREDLRYASLRSGYHGGASLAEITVPFLVFGRPGQRPPTGWRDAPPQVPGWWNEEQRVATPGLRRSRRSERQAGVLIDLVQPVPGGRAAPIDDGPQGVLAFELPLPPARTGRAASDGSVPGRPAELLISALAASTIYVHQRSRAGRHALSHDQVAAAITALAARGGRTHRDTLATALDIPASSFSNVFAAIVRLLNVDGYPVISLDADGVTVLLDEGLLREQFELGGVHG